MLLSERFHLSSLLHPDGSKFDYLTAALFGIGYFVIRFFLDRLVYGVSFGSIGHDTWLTDILTQVENLQPIGRYVLFPNTKKTDDKPGPAVQKTLKKFQGETALEATTLGLTSQSAGPG